jgi:hypothetical protein
LGKTQDGQKDLLIFAYINILPIKDLLDLPKISVFMHKLVIYKPLKTLDFSNAPRSFLLSGFWGVGCIIRLFSLENLALANAPRLCLFF